MSAEYDDESEVDPLQYADDATYDDGAARVILSRHGQWTVTAEGLEGDYHLHREYIPIGDLGHLLDYDNPEPELEPIDRIARKIWVDLEEFLAAYAEAMITHSGKYRAPPPGTFTRSAQCARSTRERSERIGRESAEKAAELGRPLTSEEEFAIMFPRKRGV